MPTPDAVRVVIGYDSREAVAYHVCCESIIRNCTMPVEIRPLALNLLPHYSEEHTDGGNAFIYSRFLIPWLYGYDGCAIFLDGDMIVRGDLAELWKRRAVGYKGVQVVKHDYQTKYPIKYMGNRNEDYPRKNWSSVTVWNCGFYPNRILTPEFVTKATGSFLHRFSWLTDEQIGELPAEWNHLCMEFEPNQNAKIYHYTVGIPPFYPEQEGADEWNQHLANANEPRHIRQSQG